MSLFDFEDTKYFYYGLTTTIWSKIVVPVFILMVEL